MGESSKEGISSAPSSPMITSPKAQFNPGFTRQKHYQPTNPNIGIFDEKVLTLVFRQLNWDPQTLCSAARTSRRMRAVADRILFFELCRSRAPRLVSLLVVTPDGSRSGGILGLGPALTQGSPGDRPGPQNLTDPFVQKIIDRPCVGSSPRIPGGWNAIAKLLLFCCGCEPSKLFPPIDATSGHFTPVSRFSKTSGKSFLVRRCWGDVLFVSDPCEHAHPDGEEEDLGVYRGVFGGFMKSRTRACLIGKNIQLHTCIRCPYCNALVWSMMAAGLIPKSASRRLGTREDNLEYFVCINGHLHGSCWLAHLSSSNDDNDDGGDDVGSGDDDCTGKETLA